MDIEAIEAIGYEDGATAARESGTDAAPPEGWDAWTINAIGLFEFFGLFGDEIKQAYAGVAFRGPWQDVPELRAVAQAYARGAQRGATEAVEG